MSGKIQVNYTAVFSQIASLRSRIKSTNNEMEFRYNQIQSSLGDLDSATNAELIEAMEKNKEKVRIVGETLDKLLCFIHNSAEQAQLEDKHMSLFITASAAGAKC